MSKQLLTEYHALCPDGICQDLLTEAEKQDIVDNGALYLTGRIQTSDKKNGNGRKYPDPILKREIQRYMQVVKDNRATGELDHPEDSVVNLKNVSHIVTEIWWNGNDVMGKVKVLDTPSGRILKDLVNAGVKLGISSRGLGSVREDSGGTIVEDDFQLICFDIVSEPSTFDAYMAPEKSGMPRRMRENNRDSMADIFKKILNS
jgi:hypothetical protein|tara:strand:- start:2454 stop:3062 length:609 start_codon:yes stop_codon:yes gene_type:complete